MPRNRFEAVQRTGRFLSGEGTKTTNVLEGISNIGGSLKDFAVSGAGMLSGGLGAALAGGATVGEWMRANMPQSQFTSGRGSGSAATTNARKNTPDPQLAPKVDPNPVVGVEVPGSPSLTTRGSVVTDADGKVLTADPKNKGFLIREDGSGRSARGDMDAGPGPAAELQGGGLTTTAPPAPRSAPAPKDPNNTGARGTSMTYDRFMQDIGSATDSRKAFEVRDPFASENLPGTAGFGASFALNSGANQQSFKEGMAGAQMVDGRIVPKVTLNAAESGQMSSYLENQRQLTPGEGSFASDPQKLGVMDTSVPESKGSDNSAENQMLRRRAAFLNAGDSLRGLRAAEGEMGLISQGGKKFARDTGAESGLQEITQDAYRARMGGGGMAQAIKDNPIASAAKGKAGARLSQSGAGSQTAATEAPSDVENPAVIGEDNKVEIIDRSDKMHGARTNFTVPTNQIPTNLKGAAGEAYLKKLDARKLTR